MRSRDAQTQQQSWPSLDEPGCTKAPHGDEALDRLLATSGEGLGCLSIEEQCHAKRDRVHMHWRDAAGRLDEMTCTFCEIPCRLLLDGMTLRLRAHPVAEPPFSLEQSPRSRRAGPQSFSMVLGFMLMRLRADQRRRDGIEISSLETQPLLFPDSPMLKLALSAAFAASMLSSSLSAQIPARMIGQLNAIAGGYTIQEIEDQATVYLAMPAGATFVVGNTVDVQGTLRLDANSPQVLFEVASIANSPSYMTVGSARLGRLMEIRVNHPGASQFFVFLSLQGDHTPLESYAPIATGTLWVSPIGMQTIAGGPMVDRWRGGMNVPNDPSLVGMTYYMQAAVHSQPGPLTFLNGRKVTVQQ
jgi:hypothetical protein